MGVGRFGIFFEGERGSFGGELLEGLLGRIDVEDALVSVFVVLLLIIPFMTQHSNMTVIMDEWRVGGGLGEAVLIFKVFKWEYKRNDIISN